MCFSKIYKCLIGCLLAVLASGLVTACAERKYPSLGQPANGIQSLAGQTMNECAIQIVRDRICLSAKWVRPPESPSSEAVLEVKFLRPNKLDQVLMPAELHEYDFEFEPWMVMDPIENSHGAPTVTIEQVDVGSFRISQIYLVMKGEWQLRFKLKPKSEEASQPHIYSWRYDFY
jgi:hypothetical protein